MSFYLQNQAGVSAEVASSGTLQRLRFGELLVNLFLGSELEAGVTNLYLRRHEESTRWLPLLGPQSPSRIGSDESSVWLTGEGLGVHYTVHLGLAKSEPTWFWQVYLKNLNDYACTLDLIYVQDLSLAHYGLVRSNEYFVSHYLDHTPLYHPKAGWVLATRQNLPQSGRHPWCLIGSLRKGVSFATDALQVAGLDMRAGLAPRGIARGLAGVRCQHEHALVAIQDAPIVLKPRASEDCGFFGQVHADHPAPSSNMDLKLVEPVVSLRPICLRCGEGRELARSLFATTALLQAQDPAEDELSAWFGTEWRQIERDAKGQLLSFFAGDEHVVVRAKELCVLRPHGHILRTGRSWVPDEAALTSTVWMAGIFHSQLTQGHVARNALLSAARGYLGLLRARGLRVFVELSGTWHLLDVPSAFAMAVANCRWFYRYGDWLIECRSCALDDLQPTMSFELSFLQGTPGCCLLVLHLALGGDDGDEASGVDYEPTQTGVMLRPPPGSELAQRFPHGGFELQSQPGTEFERIGNDALLFEDGRSRRQPYLCLQTRPAPKIGVKIVGRLVPDMSPGHQAVAYSAVGLSAPDPSAAEPILPLLEILPWFCHNAQIHYLSPRGLEQYTGGGWGTRDVTQGPVEMLLALGRFEPVREILRLVFANQNPDGGWPQWFSLFDRDRLLRAQTAHGDIVFWPLLALGRYLLATEDDSLLEESIPFFYPDQARAEQASLWQHVERALSLIASCAIPGACLACYGRGDWDDSLEPADPTLENELVSSFTVALHYQSLKTLAAGLLRMGQKTKAQLLEAAAAQVLGDFQTYLIADGVLAGLAWFKGGHIEYLMHPKDEITGVSFRLVSIVQAILAGMFTPEQARAHLALIRKHLLGPDGARLADKPFAYHGGKKRLFERAETSAFFGREIGLMYTHAHLRYAEALAEMGEAEEFWQALNQVNPIGLSSRVPQAALRQANCYYTSSDALFADRYQAQTEYGRIKAGQIPLEGGWRVYSSGPGVFVRLVVSHLLGLRWGKTYLLVDPVMPKALDGLRVRLELLGHQVDVTYHIIQRSFGPTRLIFNGAELPFTRVVHPYRLGGAQVSLASMQGNFGAEVNRLEIWL